MERGLYLANLGQTIRYKGPDKLLQFNALCWLARTLGYHIYEPHKRIIAHQNLTAFGSRTADLTLGFRGLGKSTIGTYTRVIKYIIDDPNIRILLISDTQDASERFLREIRSHLQHNEDLIEIFGPFFRSDQHSDLGRYRDSYATILQRTNRTISEPTVTCKGIGGQAASQHFDVIIPDDMVTIRNSRTPTQRATVDAWHSSTLIGCGLEHTNVHYLGTRYYPHDKYEDLERGRVDEQIGILASATLKIPAIVQDKVTGEDKSSLPERFTLEYLRWLERRMGHYHFSSQMQQDTSAGEGLVFNYSDFMWYATDDDEEVSEGLDERPRSNELAVFQFSDLTSKKTDVGAFYVSITIGVTQEHETGKRKVYVLDIERSRCGMEQQRNSILAAIQKWNPISHGVEAVAMQAGFAEEIGERYDRRVIPVKVETDKVFRARKVAPVFEGNRVYFPYPNSMLGRRMNPVIDELCSFPDSEYKDCVDALVGAITLALYGGGPAAYGSVDDGGDGNKWEDGTGLRGSY